MHMYRRDRFKLIIILKITIYILLPRVYWFCYRPTFCYMHCLCTMLSSPPLVGQPLAPAVMGSVCARGNSLNVLPDFLVIEGAHR